MPKYRVVSIDGGGIRGPVTTIPLQRIVATPGLEGFLDSTDLIAGASTGGMIAPGIAHQLDLGRIRDVYVTRGAKTLMTPGLMTWSL
jgi:patatin-like phospholipase/acyl hydrolase